MQRPAEPATTEPQVTQAQLREIYRDFRDHPRFARQSCTIRNKLGLPVPAELGPAQMKLEAAIAQQRRRSKPIRIIYLKARQVWVSMGTALEFFHDCAFAPGQKALVVAHQVDSAHEIFGYYQQLQQGYQPFGGVIETLPVIKDNDQVLAWDGGGYVKVATANNLKTGRAFSLRFLHLSEFAFWRDAKTLMTGLMQAVPDDPNTIVVIESTANGVGGEFHRLWLEASDPTSESDWIAVFFAWWEHPEYVKSPADIGYADNAAFQAALTKSEHPVYGNETELQSTYNLTLPQLAWRRWAIVNKCGKSLETFKQEYPSCPEEAFLFSGRPRFSHAHLNKMPAARKEQKDAGTCGELSEIYNGPKPMIAFMPLEKAPVVIYKKPAAGKQYVAGWDIAEGIDASKRLGSSDPDYTVGCILDQSTGEQVAKFRARMEPGPAADYAAILMRYYHWAYCVPEANGPGIAFIEQLIRNNYPPALMYHRKPSPDEQFADGDRTLLQELGWRTTGITRMQLIAGHDTRLREFSVILTDPHTLTEHLNFVVNGKGKAEASEGMHDDEVIAAALAGVGLETAPPDRTVGGVIAQRPPSSRGLKPSGAVTKYGKSRRTGDSRGVDRGQLIRF